MALRLPARAVSAPPLQPSEGASFASALPLQASTDASFAAWLEAELAQAPGAAVYGDVFADLVQGVVALVQMIRKLCSLKQTVHW